VPRLVSVAPSAATAGGRVRVIGEGFDTSGPALPDVRIGDVPARVSAARASRLTVTAPPGLPGGVLPLTVAGADGHALLQAGRAIAEGLHQVDSPAFDAQGRLHVTYSGSRGQQVPVSVFRIGRDGAQEPLVTGLVNPTALAVGPDGLIYVSSRFEGVVYKVDNSGHYETAVSDVGIACGLAFTSDGSLLVGDRSGTIFRVLPNGKAVMVASLPASVAAFHLAMGPDGNLYVTGPTLTARDHVYRVSLDGKVEIAWSVFGRPQGLAFGPDNALFIVEALAGASGLYRVELESTAPPQLVLSGAGLVGVAFDPLGGVVVASNDTAWRLEGLTVDD
jgi:sugar lactone lactonase YvrE